MLSIETDYPGANILIDSVDGLTVRLSVDLRDTAGDWFYWSFAVRGARGRVQVHFYGPNPVGVRGPALQRADGSWQWLGAQSLTKDGFVWEADEPERAVRLAMAIPYQQNELEAFLVRQPAVKASTLTLSRKGRPVELLNVGHGPRRVLLTCRHHCCESLASYALEGLLTAAAESDLGEQATLWAVPFVDKDGVEDGDQGKNRRPHDHNRDYGPRPLYPEVAAIQQLAAGWGDTPTAVALDLHCPWIRGHYNEHIYAVGCENQAIWARVSGFSQVLERVRRGPLPYQAADNLPFGQAWNTAANYGAGLSCAHWAQSLPGIELATSFELPYANAKGVVVDARSARAFGADLAAALREWLGRAQAA